MILPLAIAATSPLLAWRDAPYIVAGFAGAAAMSILLVQPLLAAGALPGLHPLRGRRWHRWTGTALLIAVLIHVGGLYLTSPPDTMDALLLVSPTPFSVYGVLGLWALIATALLVAFRKRLPLSANRWRIVHNALAVLVVVGSVVHALLIEGTMGWWSKLLLCAAVSVVTAATILYLRVFEPLRRRDAAANRRHRAR